MSNSDTISLNQINRYDNTGIKMLFEQYYCPLVMFATSYLEDQDVAKDMVQDVFLQMVQAKEKFATVENLKIYLYSAIRNRCLKYFRHEKVKMRYSRYMEKEFVAEDEYENRILEEEVFVLLKKAIDELPAQCRNVFMLALEGKGNGEIANLLNIGIETVKSHKKMGKKFLFDKLKGNAAIFFFCCCQDLFE